MKCQYPITLAWMIFIIATVRAQNRPDLPSQGVQLGLRFTATEANSPPGSCGCFFLLGAAADVALPITDTLSAAFELAGNHAGNVPGTMRGLSTVTLLAGPRYTKSLPYGQRVFIQGLFGAARGFDAFFQQGVNAQDTATVFSYALGGAYELRLSSSVALRPVQVDFVQTNLPNGSDNRQRNVRFGAGLVLHLPTSALHR